MWAVNLALLGPGKVPLVLSTWQAHRYSKLIDYSCITFSSDDAVLHSTVHVNEFPPPFFLSVIHYYDIIVKCIIIIYTYIYCGTRQAIYE